MNSPQEIMYTIGEILNMRMCNDCTKLCSKTRLFLLVLIHNLSDKLCSAFRHTHCGLNRLGIHMEDFSKIEVAFLSER